ncbi:1,2-dihydroxy-3-keto-5-methylthiopentene dioxygenase [Erysiphe neolycopersici]|uniref:Acireductone dioxygenase n=1 Tax=Erysiphe neolycopersici TaxID=212602 RepID=A0A420I0C7_9PEZI|nr:1,2-dihydroxy-3-keto-5-methylthiopentene dioxygenase [Erysiphe neolycopersici]
MTCLPKVFGTSHNIENKDHILVSSVFNRLIMRAYWYQDDDSSDQRCPHDSGRDVSPDYLAQIGVLYYRMNSEKEVDQLAKQRHYRNRDVITVSPEKMGSLYEEKVRSFFTEHLHEDEEIRYILDGAGYFDVRSKTDEWLRIRLEKDDLIILPAGIYHRFTTDEGNFITAMRLFKEDPKWTPLDRTPSVDINPYRLEYMQSVKTEVS